MNLVELDHALRKLRLSGMAAVLDTRLRQAQTEKLAPLAPKDAILVCESGLRTHADLKRMAAVGTRCFLVGESLMRQPDVERATRELLASAEAPV
mgnify:CR=1 FL=1